MRRDVLGLATTLTLLAVVVFTLGLYDQALASLTAVRTATCSSRDVVVWLQGRGNAAAGSVYYTLGLTNLSERKCALRGYPGVSAVDLAGRQVGAAAGRAHSAARRVELAPGGTAHVVLQLNDTGVFAASACRPVSAAGFRVYLPNETASSVVPLPFHACSSAGRADLHVAPVTS